MVKTCAELAILAYNQLCRHDKQMRPKLDCDLMHASHATKVERLVQAQRHCRQHQLRLLRLSVGNGGTNFEKKQRTHEKIQIATVLPRGVFVAHCQLQKKSRIVCEPCGIFNSFCIVGPMVSLWAWIRYVRVAL